MTSVLIALYDPLAALGLSGVVEDADGLHCAGLVDVDQAIRDAVVRHRPSVLVLDVQHRRADPELLGDLARIDSALRVLIMVDHRAEECAVRHLLASRFGGTIMPDALAMLDECCLTSLKTNAHGCLAREPRPEEAIRAIRTVAAGEVAAAPWVHALTDRVQRNGRPGASAPESAITARELEVIANVAKGLSNAEIGQVMGIREQTVKNHIGNAMAKLKVASRLEMGLFAAKHHVLLDDQESGPVSN